MAKNAFFGSPEVMYRSAFGGPTNNPAFGGPSHNPVFGGPSCNSTALTNGPTMNGFFTAPNHGKHGDDEPPQYAN